jgi:Fe2+ transport system protein FeoA
MERQVKSHRSDAGRQAIGVPRKAIPLSELPVGKRAVVVRVQADASIRRRLLEMGFVRGETLKVKKLAPLGDPMELVIKGYHLSLRREESACILVMRED